MLRHLPKGSLFQSYRIDKLVKERPYGDPLHRCSLTLTAVPLCPAGEALVTLAKQTLSKPLADPAAARISEHLRFCSLTFRGSAAKYSTRKSSTRSLCDLAQDDTKGDAPVQVLHQKPLPKKIRERNCVPLSFLAGAEGLEPTTLGFGDQYSTN